MHLHPEIEPMSAWILLLMMGLQPEAPWRDTYATTANAIAKGAEAEPLAKTPYSLPLKLVRLTPVIVMPSNVTSDEVTISPAREAGTLIAPPRTVSGLPTVAPAV